MKKFKSYKECTDYLFALERVGIKYDLNNISALLEILGNPQKSYSTIHIAGTNGKGSVSSMLFSILKDKGIKTGLYTSPHIRDFRERMQTTEGLVSERFVVNFTEKMYPHIQEISPSFFEITTAMAFEYFAVKNIKVGVIETGLGGRLDSTNVLEPVLSIITGIGIDHVEFLGNTIEKVAGEKAGIIKKGIPCVAGEMPQEAKAVIQKTCKKQKSAFIYAPARIKIKADEMNEAGLKYSVISERFNINKKKTSLTGVYQLKNIQTVLASVEELEKSLGIKFRNYEVTSGIDNTIKNANLQGRFQLISKHPRIILDVAHNPDGVRNLLQNLKKISYNQIYMIFAMMKDKDYKESLNELNKLKKTNVILTKPDYKRAEEPEILLKAAGNKPNYQITPDVKTALKTALENYKKGDLILVAGSFYLADDFLKEWRLHNEFK